MNDETSKATGRPWSVSKHTDPRMDGSDGSRWARVLNANGQSVIGHQIDADTAAMIVERVNGWDALVAERDRLTARVKALESAPAHEMLKEAHDDIGLLLTGRCPRDLCDEVFQRMQDRRAALEGGNA